MKVGQIVFDYIRQGRAKIDVYLSYTVSAPMNWPEGRTLAVEVLKDEKLVPFHACSDVVYSEMAHYADLILPDATYLERGGLDTRNSLDLQPYVMLRQPMVPPPGEARSYADVLFDIGRKLNPAQSRYFQFGDHEAFVRHQCSNIPRGGEASGFEYMKKFGVYVYSDAPKNYGIYRRALNSTELKGSRLDGNTNVVYKTNGNGKETAIGLMIEENGKKLAVRGFHTPSRKFEIFSSEVEKAARAMSIPDTGWPEYVPIPAHQQFAPDRFIVVTFKWNVHTQARTASQKYLSEIVHDNPIWINATSARKLGIKNGDWVELTTYRPLTEAYGTNVYRPGVGESVGSQRLRAFVTEGIHPRALAISNSLGHLGSGRAATARRGPRDIESPIPVAGYGHHSGKDDLDDQLWWDKRFGGTGNGYNVNALFPIQPQPLTGMQAWCDTVCQLRRLNADELSNST
jgi:anaerobic selenocysteine-containing dehydrogenase